MKTKILVTGHLGFIGSHLVDRLVKKYEVFGIDDLSGGYLRNGNKKLSMGLYFDLRDQEGTKEMVDLIKPDVIYHLAANAAEGKSHFCPIDICTRNYDTFLNVITPAINNGLKKFIFTSSMAVYGTGQVPFKEDAVPLPEDPYGASKLAAEQTLKVLSEVHSFEYTIVRPHNVYGPRQNMSDPYRNVVTIFMNAVLNNKPYFIYGDGEQRRCFSYIKEVADSMAKCIEKGNGMTFNIGSDYDYSINDLSNAITVVTGTKHKPIELKDRANEVKIAIPDHTQAKKYLGHKDKMSFIRGIEKTWEYAKELGYQKPIKTDFEIMSDKIPEDWL